MESQRRASALSQAADSRSPSVPLGQGGCLREYGRIQNMLLEFALAPVRAPTCSPRTVLDERLAQVTRRHACIHWDAVCPKRMEIWNPVNEPKASEVAGEDQAVDRWYELRFHRTRFGLLGLDEHYLPSFEGHDIARNLARLLSLTIAFVEHQTFVLRQTQSLRGSSVLYSPTPTTMLTPRLLATLHSLIEGETEEQQARRLGIEVATAHAHRHRLYQRLGVHSAHEAVLCAFRYRMVDWLGFSGISD